MGKKTRQISGVCTFLKGKKGYELQRNRKGDASFLNRVKYIITLDADTQLPLESTQRMIGTLHLPFNRQD
ncbi:hypothetical protein KHA80_00595 [Anaerobacillus sp. HL2]|nr:hypothetical protein KHA80_00595 [Anaerobacillus sp. HL2]